MAIYKGNIKVSGVGANPGAMPTVQPSNPVAGSTYFDTTNNVLKIYNGTSWDSIATGGNISDQAYGPSWDGQTTTAPSKNAVYDAVSSVINNAGASDHLEEMALVGEKYALTDTLFKQLTPKLADCTVDANVGDVAANTEIHIQRQGSKTASNKLKLKVKKVGSPTTSLYVEVRKGIQVDVSSSEAYWYGDSSNIIATGSLASSSFSNDYAEVEFTLDNNFGGTEGELLDIVVYQTAGSGATVNASNYYVLACDSTQWSEGFSYVCVNGTTRTRQKLMPYCVSSGFVQAMLSKVSSSTITANNVIKDRYRINAGGGDPAYPNFKEFIVSDYVNKNKISGTISVKVGLQDVTTGNAINRVYILDSASGVPKFSQTDTRQGTSANQNYTLSYNFNDIDIVKGVTYFRFEGTYNYGGYGNFTVTINHTLTKKGIKGEPRGLKNIGKKVSTTLFGIHTDRTRVTQDA